MKKAFTIRTQKFLLCFSVLLFLIFLRLFHLGIIQKESRFKSSRATHRHTYTHTPLRGTIRDRFDIPLAVNIPQHNVAVRYSALRKIPRLQRKRSLKKVTQTFPRREYAKKLAQFLADTLELNTSDVEDLLLGHAALFPHTDFIVKENISEKLYYNLKMQERDWPGLKAVITPKRFYPQQNTAAHVLGYLGVINQEEFLAIRQEKDVLKQYLAAQDSGQLAFLPPPYHSPSEARTRLQQIHKKKYSINTEIGKCGIEALFDNDLRGIPGESISTTDIYGNFVIQDLSGTTPPTSGKRILLTLSAELQKTAEELLIAYETFQDVRDKVTHKCRRSPFIRGGAIVAMNPHSGEILALASSPSFDPNDFTPLKGNIYHKRQNVNTQKWLESPEYLEKIWRGLYPLERLRLDKDSGLTQKEEHVLTWPFFLQLVLDSKCPLSQTIQDVSSWGEAHHIASSFASLVKKYPQMTPTALLEELLSHQGHLHPEDGQIFSQILLPYLRKMRRSHDQLLFLDFMQLLTPKAPPHPEIYPLLEELPLNQAHLMMQQLSKVCAYAKELAYAHFHAKIFPQWREENEAAFIKEKRQEERRRNKWATPYPEYLKKKERELFSHYWAEKSIQHIHDAAQLLFTQLSPWLQELHASLSPTLFYALCDHLQCLDPLDRPLWAPFLCFPTEKKHPTERDLATSFHLIHHAQFLCSKAFQEACPLGSVFKIVPAYAALLKQYTERQGSPSLKDQELNPLTLTDSTSHDKKLLGFFANGTPIHRLYKGGILPSSIAPKGELSLPKALECSSNLYFPILAIDYLSPEYLIQCTQDFSFGTQTGITLPGEYAGHLPPDLDKDPTNIYAFSIGQHSLVVTPLQTAVMLAAVANGGHVLQPQICKKTIQTLNQHTEDNPYQKYLTAVGIPFPIFLFNENPSSEPSSVASQPLVKRQLPFPPEIQHPLWEGLHLVLNGSKGTARKEKMHPDHFPKQVLRSYHKQRQSMYGKTGTAEILHKNSLDNETPLTKEKHVWFACMGGLGGAAEHNAEIRSQDAEIIVVVFLKFGSAGSQGAPLAAHIIETWHNILQRHQEQDNKGGAHAFSKKSSN